MSFDWKGKTLSTMSDIMDVVCKITEREVAQEFMKAYMDSTPFAVQNLGYFTGYYDSATAARIMGLFGVVHPIFGKLQVSPERAFKMGKDWATATKK